MSKHSVPQDVREELTTVVFKAAEEQCYFNKSANENTAFLDMLVEKIEVGQRLSEFMPKARVRTYIKDAILSNYKYDIIKRTKPKERESVLKELFGTTLDVVIMDESKPVSRKSQITLFKEVERDKYYVLVDGTYQKWETALKKALLYLAPKPFRKTCSKTTIVLLLFASNRTIPDSDLKLLKEALSVCNASAYIFG